MLFLVKVSEMKKKIAMGSQYDGWPNVCWAVWIAVAGWLAGWMNETKLPIPFSSWNFSIFGEIKAVTDAVKSNKGQEQYKIEIELMLQSFQRSPSLISKWKVISMEMESSV